MKSTASENDIGSANVAVGELQITTVPKGATVKIDGQARGMSPVGLRIARGTRIMIVAEHDGFVAASQTITVGEVKQEVSLTLMPIPVTSAIDAGTLDASITATAPATGTSTKTTKTTKPGTKDPRRGNASTTSGSGSYNPNDVGGD